MTREADATAMPHNAIAATTCRVESCDRPRARVGPKSHSVYCSGHLQRWLKHGDLREDLPIGYRSPGPDTCAVDGCERPRSVISKEPPKRSSLCAAHRARRSKYGDVRADVPVRETATSVMRKKKP